MNRFLTGFLMLLGLTGAAFGRGTEEDAEAIYREYADTIIRAYETGDIDLYMSVFSDDFVAMPPGAPVVIGTDAYRPMAQPFFDPAMNVEVTVEPEEVVMAGGWIIARAAAVHAMTPADGNETTTLNSKILEVLHRQEDGSWKCHTVCWNAAQTPAASVTEEDALE
jgi:uncharacterized protein (TIGR02246 family)